MKGSFLAGAGASTSPSLSPTADERQRSFWQRVRRRAARMLDPASYEQASGSAVAAGAEYFFVCGYPKSGTHWVANIVNLHPHAFCHGELHLQRIRRQIWQMYTRPIYRDAEAGGKFRPELEEAFDALAKRMLDSVARWRPGARLLGDHSPEPLHAIFGADAAGIERTRYLHIVRDGRDVAVSWTYHWLRSKGECYVPSHLQERYRRARALIAASTREGNGALWDQAADLLRDVEWVEHCAREWRTRIEMDRATMRGDGARHWPSAHPGAIAPERVLEMRYETLHAHTQRERDRIFAFLGLDAALSEPLSHETKTLPGFKSENPANFYRKGQIGDWRGYLGEEQRRAYARVAGKTLIELGYEQDEGWVAGDGRDTAIAERVAGGGGSQRG